MPDRKSAAGAEHVQVPAWLRIALHDLCQPLCALDCLLHMMSEAGTPVYPFAKQQTEPQQDANVGDARAECARMIVILRAIQTRLADL